MKKNNNNLNNAAANNNNMNGGFIMATGTIKTVEDFAQMAKEAFEAEYPECEVEVRKVTKNNGLVLTGIMVKEEGSNLAPTIYMDGAFADYMDGRPAREVLRGMYGAYESSRTGRRFDTASFLEEGKGRVCFRLVNAARNRELLSSVPHIPYLDLAIVFFIPVSADGMGEATATVSNSIMEAWGMTDVEELYATAKENTQARYKGCVSGLMDVLAAAVSPDCAADDGASFGMDSVYEDTMPIYVATNAQRLHGAAAMLYDGLLSGFAKRVGGDFYILPSSIHEVILLPADGDMDAGSLAAMVREINRTKVAADEVLSDNVYRYNAGTDSVEMA